MPSSASSSAPWPTTTRCDSKAPQYNLATGPATLAPTYMSRRGSTAASSSLTRAGPWQQCPHRTALSSSGHGTGRPNGHLPSDLAAADYNGTLTRPADAERWNGAKAQQGDTPRPQATKRPGPTRRPTPDHPWRRMVIPSISSQSRGFRLLLGGTIERCAPLTPGSRAGCPTTAGWSLGPSSSPPPSP